MKTIMDDEQIESLEDIEIFLRGVRKNGFRIPSIEERYKWITRILKKFRYLELQKKEKGVVLKYLVKRTEYSRQQMSRLIGRYQQEGKVMRKEPRRYRFPQKYGAEEIRLLLKTDT